ncbi:MAG TPA: hypothetical protein VGQ83_36630 [Polyangia bacterium]|jgi:hypothetical protein
MTTTKVALTIARDVLIRAKKQVKGGRSKSLSAFVTEAVDEKIRRDELQSILDEMDARHGKPGKTDRAWAERVLKRSS